MDQTQQSPNARVSSLKIFLTQKVLLLVGFVFQAPMLPFKGVVPLTTDKYGDSMGFLFTLISVHVVDDFDLHS